MRIDDDVLPFVTRYHDHFRRKTRGLDVKLHAVTAGIAHGRTADTARTLRPLTTHLVLRICGELAAKVEIIAIARTPELKVNIAVVAAPLTVIGIAADPFGCSILGPQCPRP